MTLGKYLEGAGVSGTYANTNPSLRMPQTTPVFGTAGVTRAWNDANQNFVPDCDLMNAAAQDLRTAGGDLCGVLSNTSFGTNVLTNSFDPGLLGGWGVRPSDWHLGISLEQQLGSRSSVAVTYTRRWYDGFSVVDNRALQPSDLTPFSIVAPVDPRLPDGGGYVVSGLYDVVPEKSGASTISSPIQPGTEAGSGLQRARRDGESACGQGTHPRCRHQHLGRPSPTTAVCGRIFPSLPLRQPGRAHSALAWAAPPSRP